MFAKLFEFVAWLHGGGKTVEQVCREWHSFVIGVGDGFAFTGTTIADAEDLKGEVHYYKAGVFVGRLAFVVTIGGLIKWVVFA